MKYWFLSGKGLHDMFESRLYIELMSSNSEFIEFGSQPWILLGNTMCSNNVGEPGSFSVYEDGKKGPLKTSQLPQ